MTTYRFEPHYMTQAVPVKERKGLRCESCGTKPAGNYCLIRPFNKFLCTECHKTTKAMQAMDKVVNGDA